VLLLVRLFHHCSAFSRLTVVIRVAPEPSAARCCEFVEGLVVIKFPLPSLQEIAWIQSPDYRPGEPCPFRVAKDAPSTVRLFPSPRTPPAFPSPRTASNPGVPSTSPSSACLFSTLFQVSVHLRKRMLSRMAICSQRASLVGSEWISPRLSILFVPCTFNFGPSSPLSFLLPIASPSACLTFGIPQP